MDDIVPKVINSKGFTYFKSQTASGKTKRIIDALVKDSFFINKVIYAVPTHVLAQEIEERLNATVEASGVDLPIYRVPQREYTSLDLLLLKLGLPAQMKDENRSAAIEKLFDGETRGVFIITHSLLVNLKGNLPVDKIIVDENIEDALITNVKITIPQLHQLQGYVPKLCQEQLTHLIHLIKEGEMGESLPKLLPQVIKEIDCDSYLEDVTEEDAIAGLFSVGNAESVRVSRIG